MGMVIDSIDALIFIVASMRAMAARIHAGSGGEWCESGREISHMLGHTARRRVTDLRWKSGLRKEVGRRARHEGPQRGEGRKSLQKGRKGGGFRGGGAALPCTPVPILCVSL